MPFIKNMPDITIRSWRYLKGAGGHIMGLSRRYLCLFG